MTEETPRGHIIDVQSLPTQFPTHRHEPAFWERLGRTVATFGALEDTLARAVFALTATRQYQSLPEAERAFEKWLPMLERAVTSPLGGLIPMFEKAVRDHHEQSISDLDNLIGDLRKALVWRNTLCHCSWGEPDSEGASLPNFVNRKMEKFERPVDQECLDQVQRGTAEIMCSVVNTVTNLGLQFPGTDGPGTPVRIS